MYICKLCQYKEKYGTSINAKYFYIFLLYKVCLISHFKDQMRVMVKDSFGHYLSIPEELPIKFNLLQHGKGMRHDTQTHDK